MDVPIPYDVLWALAESYYWQTVIFFTMWLTTFLFAVILFKVTPVGIFMKAKMKRLNLIINPTENGYLQLLAAKPLSRFSVYKEGKISTYFSTNPDDRYLEDKSKIPAFINYGKFAFSMKPMHAFIMRKLKDNGIKNWVDLQVAMKKAAEEGQNLMLEIKPKQQFTYEQIAGMLMEAGVKEWDKDTVFGFGGESIDFDNIDMMFGENERGDIIEAEIQRRTAAEMVKRFGFSSDTIKWIIGFGMAGLLIFIGASVFMNAIPAVAPAVQGAASGGLVIG